MLRRTLVALLIHQLDESRDGVAVIAMIIAVLHVVAAAVTGHLARTGRVASPALITGGASE